MGRLSEDMLGTWELTLREDRAEDGTLVPEHTLGPNPKGMLIYDRGGNFAAQFMKLDRSAALLGGSFEGNSVSMANNTQAAGGYDAYFGKFTVDNDMGTVTQELSAALSPQNVGQVVTRALEVEGDTMTISLNTTTAGGHAVTRLLLWRRIA